MIVQLSSAEADSPFSEGHHMNGARGAGKSRPAPRTLPAGPAAARQSGLVAFMRSQASVAALLAGTAVLACGGSTQPPSAGAATKLSFTVQPSSATARAGIAPAVAIQDASGNTVTSATGAVTVALGANPGGGTLSGTTTVNPVNGVANFSGLSINKAGIGYTLVASSIALTSATSAAFTIAPGPPTTIAVNDGNNQSTLVGAAVTTPPSVKVIDADGNGVSGVSVTFAVASGGGSISGASPSTSASGIASVGSWTLGATAGANTMTAAAAGLAGSPVTFAATGLQFRSFTAGYNQTCSLMTGGAAYCWGLNAAGALGDGTTTNRSLPVAVGGGLTFQTLVTGGAHSCGVATGGAAYCWGGNNGQLGDGTSINRLIPTPVAGGLSFQSVAAGFNHTCGVTTGGAAYCWGNNDYGQLGDGTLTTRFVPVPVAAGLSFQSLVTGELYTCGVTTGGVGYCWGNNFDGQLGDGTGTNRSTPVAVVGGGPWRNLTAGKNHTCGATTGGIAYCWGGNQGGQLGDGTKTGRTSAVAVAGAQTFQALAAGSYYTCGLTTGGAAYCWGSNIKGNLGDGTTTDHLTPAPVAGGLTFGGLAAGQDHVCGVTTGGAGYCWGYNGSGQLGDGSATDRPAPVAVRWQ